MSESTTHHSSLSWVQSAAVFIGGGLLISLGDRAHISFGVLVQDDTSFFGQAWWVVPMFGVVSLTLFHGYRGLRGWFGEPPAQRDPNRALINAVFFLAVYCSTGPLAQLGFTLALLLGGLWLIRVVVQRESRATILLCVLLAVLGPIGEAVVSTIGMFHYTHPDLGLAHSWLPAVYLHGGLVVPRVEALLLPITHTAPAGMKQP